MKRLSLWISLVVILFLVSCNLPASGLSNRPAAQSTATLSPVQIQTEISAMLTVMPTATPQTPESSAVVTPTMALPTVAVEQPTATAESAPPQEEASPTSTNTPAAEATPVMPTATQPAPTATSQPQGPTATLSPGDPRARQGAPTSTDTMDNPTPWLWPTGTDKYSSATFSNGVQVITSLDTKAGWRLANPTGHEFTNTYIEATFKTNTCSGMDQYGIMLRVPVLSEPDQGYLFGVTCDGRYSLRRWDSKVSPKGEMKRLVDWTTSSAINAGSNQTNRLGIFAVGKRLILYVNGALLTEAQDTLFPSGYFGVFIDYDSTKDLSVQIDEMSYWVNPQP